MGSEWRQVCGGRCAGRTCDVKYEQRPMRETSCVDRRAEADVWDDVSVV